jgi:hypothetical protein
MEIGCSEGRREGVWEEQGVLKKSGAEGIVEGAVPAAGLA